MQSGRERDEKRKVGGDQLVFLIVKKVSSARRKIPFRSFCLRGGACAMEGFMLLTNCALCTTGVVST